MKEKEIIEYTTPKGQKRFKFLVYAGKDSTTGKSITIRKQGFKSYKEAFEALLKVKEAVMNDEYKPITEKRLKFVDLYNIYLEFYRKQVKESTILNFTSRAKNNLLPLLGDVYLDKLTPAICQNAINELANKHPYQKGYISDLGQVIKYGVTLGLIKENPLNRTIKPRLKKKKQIKKEFYTKEELERFLDSAKKAGFKWYVLFRVLAYTGIRFGEMASLIWNDINFSESTLTISKTRSVDTKNKPIITTPKTESSNRTIYLDSQTLQDLLYLRYEQQKNVIYLGESSIKNDLVFPTYHGDYLRPHGVDYHLRRIAKEAGIERIKIHGFRHTHASLCFEAGMSMQDVKERLGHSTIQTTMDVYTHVTKGQAKASAEQFAKFMQA